MKKLALLLAAAIAVCSLGSFSACSNKKPLVGLICLHGDESTYDKNFIDAFKAACKEKGILFLQGKGSIGVRKCEKTTAKEEVASNGNEYTVTVNGKKYGISLDGKKAVVNGKTYDFDVKSGIETTQNSGGDGQPVKAALPGTVLRVLVSAGDSISEGDVIAVIEAMKMETEIKSPLSGTIKEVDIEAGSKVKTGDTLVTIG